MLKLKLKRLLQNCRKQKGVKTFDQLLAEEGNIVRRGEILFLPNGRVIKG